MNWLELMRSGIQLDQVDRDALACYEEVKEFLQQEHTHEEVTTCGFDPDMVNEFCYYPPTEWDRLIGWAKKYYGDENDAPLPYTARMFRAVLFENHLDAENLDAMQNQTPHIYSGDMLLGFHQAFASQVDDPPSFEETNFQFLTDGGVTLFDAREQAEEVAEAAPPIEHPLSASPDVFDESDWLDDPAELSGEEDGEDEEEDEYIPMEQCIIEAEPEEIPVGEYFVDDDLEEQAREQEEWEERQEQERIWREQEAERRREEHEETDRFIQTMIYLDEYEDQY